MSFFLLLFGEVGSCLCCDITNLKMWLNVVFHCLVIVTILQPDCSSTCEKRLSPLSLSQLSLSNEQKRFKVVLVYVQQLALVVLPSSLTCLLSTVWDVMIQIRGQSLIYKRNIQCSAT